MDRWDETDCSNYEMPYCESLEMFFFFFSEQVSDYICQVCAVVECGHKKEAIVEILYRHAVTYPQLTTPLITMLKSSE